MGSNANSIKRNNVVKAVSAFAVAGACFSIGLLSPKYIQALNFSEGVEYGYSADLNQVLNNNNSEATSSDERIVVLAEKDIPAITASSEASQNYSESSIEEIVIGFETIEKEDPNLYEGEKETAVEGEEGRILETYNLTYDSKDELVSKELIITARLSEPVDEVILVGTKKKPEPEPEPVQPKAPTSSAPVDPGSNRSIGKQLAEETYGWSGSEWHCLNSLWTRESNWHHTADNPTSSAYGIPQALPGSKMSSAGSDWLTNPSTQIKWGLKYIKGRYGTPCNAWGHSEQKGWY